MSAVTIPWLAACAVLGIAGAAKLRRPAPTQGALRAAHLPATRAAVRLLGVAELVAAIASATTGNRLLAAAIALLHVGFAAFVWAALRRGGMVQSCGCFGSPDVPATVVHVWVDLAVAGLGAVAATAGAATVGDLIHEGAGGMIALVMVGIVTYEVLLVMTVLPRATLRAAAASAW